MKKLVTCFCPLSGTDPGTFSEALWLFVLRGVSVGTWCWVVYILDCIFWGWFVEIGFGLGLFEFGLS